MHPVLFRISFLPWAIPLGPLFLLLALAGLGVALLSWWSPSRERGIVGAAVAVTALVLAAVFWNRGYRPGGLVITGYGASLAVSLVAGWGLTLGLAERDGIPREAAGQAFVYAVFAGLVAARIGFGLTHLESPAGLSQILNFARGGLASYSGLVGGVLGSVAYLRLRGLSWQKWVDAAAPSAALGEMITRFGTYLTGSGFGLPLPPWAPDWLRTLGTFPRWEDPLVPQGAPAWARHVERGWIGSEAVHSLAVHPTQLYLMLGGGILLAVAYFARRSRQFPGQVFLAYAFGYGVLRFVVDGLRDDPYRAMSGPYFRAWVVIPLGLLMLGAAFIYGPSRSIGRTNVRRIGGAIALLPAVAAYFLLKVGPNEEPIRLAQAQWLALLSALGAVLVWGIRLAGR